ncbi:LytR/AlgR family response regulator transcription factor [Pseudocnuella soli]|uniref:LytR/AlgR family response regulator transcription factor n=1 Tax=Pseudocnuella soli TaxID=2502779 RepID=UPI0010532D0F|nr:LytTR family DNA-binding domain-containing protein [Pseudocnuella soli]
MRRFLLQPYPFVYHVGRKLRVCAGIGLFITLFLGVFQPFGLSTLPQQTVWLHALLFGLVTFVISGLLQAGLPRIFPQPFSEAHWKSWKELLYLFIILLFVAAGNYALLEALYGNTHGQRSFWSVLLITAEVGVFPLIFVVFLKQLMLYRRYAAAAQEVNVELKAPPAPQTPEAIAAPQPALLTLRGEGQKEQLDLPANAILFIASSDNYVRVAFLKNKAAASQLLRASLKSMEQQVAAHPQLFRCHRMYLVNLDQVVQVSGNAQGLRLHLQGSSEAVPVSRSLTQTVKDRLAHLSHSPQ